MRSPPADFSSISSCVSPSHPQAPSKGSSVHPPPGHAIPSEEELPPPPEEPVTLPEREVSTGMAVCLLSGSSGVRMGFACEVWESRVPPLLT